MSAYMVIDPGPEAIFESLRPAKPKSGERMPPMRCALERDAHGAVLLAVLYVLDNRWGIERIVEQVVPLQATRPNFGGVR